MSYLKNKLDATHKPIAEHLRRCGVEVLELLHPLDLLARKGDTVCWVECKIPGSRACYTAVQLRFVSETGMNVAFARSGDEAMRAIRERRFISRRHKDAIAAMLVLKPKGKYTPAEIDTLLAR